MYTHMYDIPHLLQATLQTGFPETLRPLTPQPPAHKLRFSEEEMAYQAGMGGMVGRGRVGATGPRGEKGDQGEVGPQGIPAPQGKDGKKR